MLHYWMGLQIRERRGANGVLRISKKKKQKNPIYFYLGDGWGV